MPRRAGGSVNIRGVEVLHRRMALFPGIVTAGVTRAARKETEAVAQDMIDGAPMLTGALRESIKSTFNERKIRGEAFTKLRYAGFVENGTDDTAAQPFALPAAEDSRVRFPERVRLEVRAELLQITG